MFVIVLNPVDRSAFNFKKITIDRWKVDEHFPLIICDSSFATQECLGVY